MNKTLGNKGSSIEEHSQNWWLEPEVRQTQVID